MSLWPRASDFQPGDRVRLVNADGSTPRWGVLRGIVIGVDERHQFLVDLGHHGRKSCSAVNLVRLDVIERLAELA